MIRKILGGREFRTQKAIIEYARLVKSRHVDGEILSGNDHEFMLDFIQLHERSAEKIGCGVKGFTIQRDEHWGNSRQFVLIRIDGSRAIFSHNALRLKPQTEEERHRDRAIHAMREAIVPQIIEFKIENFIAGMLCPLTGEVITEPHVDHIKPQTFEALVAGWMEIKGYSFANVEVSSDSDNRTFEIMSNPEQLSSWRLYHSIHAKLRILSKGGNLGPARRA